MSDAPTGEHAMHCGASTLWPVSRQRLSLARCWLCRRWQAKVAESGCDICTSFRGWPAKATSEMLRFNSASLRIHACLAADVDLDDASDCTTKVQSSLDRLATLRIENYSVRRPLSSRFSLDDPCVLLRRSYASYVIQFNWQLPTS